MWAFFTKLMCSSKPYWGSKTFYPILDELHWKDPEIDSKYLFKPKFCKIWARSSSTLCLRLRNSQRQTEMKRCCQVGVRLKLKGSQTFGRTTIGRNYKSLHWKLAKNNFILKENSSWGPSKGNKYFKAITTHILQLSRSGEGTWCWRSCFHMFKSLLSWTHGSQRICHQDA